MGWLSAGFRAAPLDSGSGMRLILLWTHELGDLDLCESCHAQGLFTNLKAPFPSQHATEISEDKVNLGHGPVRQQNSATKVVPGGGIHAEHLASFCHERTATSAQPCPGAL